MSTVPGSRRADRVLRAGAVVTAVGLGFLLVALVPLLFPDVHLSSAMWFLSMLTAVGLAIIAVGLAMSPKRSRR